MKDSFFLSTDSASSGKTIKSSKIARTMTIQQHVIYPDFHLDLTGFFPGKQ